MLLNEQLELSESEELSDCWKNLVVVDMFEEFRVFDVANGQQINAVKVNESRELEEAREEIQFNGTLS